MKKYPAISALVAKVFSTLDIDDAIFGNADGIPSALVDASEEFQSSGAGFKSFSVEQMALDVSNDALVEREVRNLINKITSVLAEI